MTTTREVIAASESGSGRASVFRSAIAFAAAMARASGWRLVPALTAAVALALVEGVGVVLLVPLLGAIGLVVTEGPTSGIARWTTRLFASVGSTASLPAVLLVFLSVSAVYAALYRSHLLLSPALEQSFVLGLRGRLYRAIVSARWPFLVQRRMSDMGHALLSDMERVSGSAYQLLSLTATAAVSMAYIAFAVRISPGVTSFVCGGALVALWLVRGRTRAAAERGEAVSHANRKVYGMVTESLAGLKVAKSVGAEARDAAAYEAMAQASSSVYLDLLRAFADAKRRLDLASACGIAVILLAAVHVFNVRGTSLLLLLFVFARVAPRMLSLQDSLQLFAGGLPAFANVMQLIESCEREGEPLVAGDRPRIGVRQGIELSRVTFTYRSEASPVLRDVTFAIPAGRVTALVGASGAGKSTIADLVLGLLTPTLGTVLVDGRALGGDRLVDWRRSIGYVPQDTFLLHDTIRQNMLWASPGTTDAEIREALDLAAARQFVDALPEGLDTIVGDRGVRLSGGERQRLALARALLTRPSLLVLDEATSALDSPNEQQILDAVRRLGSAMTVLIIAHRLSTVRHADAIHVLSSGRLVESGSWDELLTSNGAFTALWHAQRSAIDAAV
jgi:ATP-binding cassette subfamily C protein